MRTTTRLMIVLCLASTICGVARADPFADGLAAYRSGDYVQAMQLWRAASDQGDARAAANIGVLYAAGRGVAADPAEAVRWFRLAAGRGDTNSQLMLASRLLNGDGVAPNPVEAQQLLRPLAERGDGVAMFYMGDIYRLGQGVPVDTAEAIRWYRLSAAVPDNPQAGRATFFVEALTIQQDLNRSR